MGDASLLSRRALLFGGAVSTAPRHEFFPPWARTGSAFAAACTRCDACIRACPEQVLMRGADGLPRFDAHAGVCTFCGDCKNACDSGAFEPERDPPWTLVAQVADTCFSARGIVCASCRDVCLESAIRVPPAARGAASIDAERCTGCAACVQTCPADAIVLRQMEAIA